jgi:hypothetical protein
VRRTTVVAAAGGLLLLGGLVWWLGSSGEEGLETFVHTVTGTIGPSNVQRGLEWVDPSRQPLEVQARGMGKLYDARNADSLRADARRALQPYLGDDVRPLRQAVKVEGDTGHVDLQLLTGRGLVNASFRFRRHGDRWLMDRARVR